VFYKYLCQDCLIKKYIKESATLIKETDPIPFTKEDIDKVIKMLLEDPIFDETHPEYIKQKEAGIL